tara:strand:- start:1217 stop:2299 length:1083 start_codon:yes stop_codon:yes gene_type:complete
MTRRQALINFGAMPFFAKAGVDAKKNRIEISVERATNFLLKMQEDDGSFSDSKSRDAAKNGYAMTAMGVLALASIGHQPGDPGKVGLALQRALNFILRRDQMRGEYEYFGADGSRMYGHGITTLCLTEMIGMSVNKKQEQRLRTVSQKAINMILRSQMVRKSNSKHQGGWRYEPNSNDSDLSVTVWQLMALRSAKNAGLLVPKRAIDEAVLYLKRSYFSPRDARGLPINMRSGCGYMPGRPPEFATAAAGLLSLQVCGEYDAPEVRGSVAWLARKKVVPREMLWFYYGIYYYSQGMRKREKPVAEKAKKVTEDVLLNLQQADGSWVGMDGMERGAGRIYCTTLSILSLSVQYRYLPIYQH